jgi:hypothetical protein
MCCDPLKPIVPIPEPVRSRRQEFFQSARERMEPKSNSPNSHPIKDIDLEGNVKMTDEVEVRAGTLDLNHYRIVDEVWHFCSTDWGLRCRWKWSRDRTLAHGL